MLISDSSKAQTKEFFISYNRRTILLNQVLCFERGSPINVMLSFAGYNDR